jgi:hypothetical protein
MNLIKANNRFEREAGIDHFLFRPCAGETEKGTVVSCLIGVTTSARSKMMEKKRIES